MNKLLYILTFIFINTLFPQEAGCTDTYASNYSSSADFDDGSCNYTSNGDYFMEFDGVGDVIYIPDSDALDLSDKGTIMFWMKPNTINQPGNAGLVVKSDNGSSGGDVYGISYYVVWRQNEGKLKAYISDGNSSNSISYENLEHLADGDWHHITFTWDGNELRLYVDSQLKSTEIQTISGAFNSSYNLKIGGDSYGTDGGSSDHFNGWIDDVWILAYHIYGDDYPDNGNWAYIPAYIMQNKYIPTNWGLYTGGYVKGHWSFNDNDSSTVALDYTGNQNHGTINNSVYSDNIFCDQHSDCASDQFCCPAPTNWTSIRVSIVS